MVHLPRSLTPWWRRSRSPEIPALVPAVHEGRWLRPGPGPWAEPRWGTPGGLQLGIWPIGGPRGLLRVYAPYLGHPYHELLNFLAIEPIVGHGRRARRGESEMEWSRLDREQGKRLWSAEGPGDPAPGRLDRAARGQIDEVDGVERLSAYVICERFRNGADVTVRVRFRADRPHEVGLAVRARAGSVQPAAVVLSATMGNFARLRVLRLADGEATPATLWPKGYAGSGFTSYAGVGLDRLPRNGAGDAIASFEPDEPDPGDATYAPGTEAHWRYSGRPAAQTFRVPHPDPALRAQTKARATYWASTSPIPGGLSFENVEVVQPFRDGQEIFFTVEPLDRPPG